MKREGKGSDVSSRCAEDTFSLEKIDISPGKGGEELPMRCGGGRGANPDPWNIYKLIYELICKLIDTLIYKLIY